MRPPAPGVNVSLVTGLGHGGDAEGDTLIRIENLTGSAFNDTLEGNGGNNVLTGGAGIDTVSYEHAPAGVTVSLAVTTAQNTIGAGTDTLSGFENLIGSAFDDTLTGDAGANVLTGLAGNDIAQWRRRRRPHDRRDGQRHLRRRQRRRRGRRDAAAMAPTRCRPSISFSLSDTRARHRR